MRTTSKLTLALGLSAVLTGIGCEPPTVTPPPPPPPGGNGDLPPFISGLVDADEDGIPDEFEIPGTTLYDWGARINQRDLFIEIDYMDSTNGGQYPINYGTVPQEEALQKVVDTFAAQGIAVHFDVGDLYDQSGDNTLNPARFDLGGGQQLPYATGLTIGEVSPYRNSHMASYRRTLFYYGLFGIVNPDGSAFAYLKGDFFYITNGNAGLNKNTPADVIALINKQSETIFHEFGHNLGLHHGGPYIPSVPDSAVLYKPNYVSSMNYLYAWKGLSGIGPGEDEGDRYYYRYQSKCGALYPVNGSTISYPLSSPDFKIDYSHGTNTVLDEAMLVEADGLGSGSGVPIDWNCNGVLETLIDYDINGDGLITVLTDPDDWSNLFFKFAQSYPAAQDENWVSPYSTEVIVIKE